MRIGFCRCRIECAKSLVMAGLVPAIHVFDRGAVVDAWMPGTRPGMTVLG